MAADIVSSDPTLITGRTGRLSPVNRRRWDNFKANRRGFWSFWIFLVLFGLSLGAEFIANDRPVLVSYKGGTAGPGSGAISGGKIPRRHGVPGDHRLWRAGNFR